jgi:ankyrin repeat protein
MSMCRLFRSPFFSPKSCCSSVTVVMLAALAWSGLAFCGEIHNAAITGDLSKVKALIQTNPELVFSQDKFGDPPLHWAASFGHMEVAELLLANRARGKCQEQ